MLKRTNHEATVRAKKKPSSIDSAEKYICTVQFAKSQGIAEETALPSKIHIRSQASHKVIFSTDHISRQTTDTICSVADILSVNG